MAFFLAIQGRFFLLEKVFAAGINNITVLLQDQTISTLTSVEVSFEIENPIPENGKIQIEFPTNFSDLQIATMTGSNLGVNPVFGTGETATTLEIQVGV